MIRVLNLNSLRHERIFFEGRDRLDHRRRQRLGPGHRRMFCGRWRACRPDRAARGHDITALEENENLIKWVSKSIGPISILANNAGTHLKKPAVETTPAEFSNVLQTHVVAAFSLTRAVLPQMIQRKHGSILFTASMASLFGIPLVVAYSAAKSAYLGMVRSLATEVSPLGVRVNAVAPGWIESDMMLNALNGDPARSKKILGRTPMNRFGTAKDVGLAATYLCSPAARFVTGVFLPVDGGVSIGF
jgi:NAD(P)-dependent dehydrogenase (short-subunit alcohol dehydrogenase family)